MSDQKRTRAYWENNISGWGEYYLDISHSGEQFGGPKWLEAIYRLTIMPIEAKLMKQRYQLTVDFIRKYIKKDMTVVDVGCGTGIFTIEMLNNNASVIAVDFAQTALDITKKMVEKYKPDSKEHVKYLLLDISQERLPKSDAALIMGVTPYVENLSSLLDNILPSTKMIYCLYIDPRHWANSIRKLLPFLNVRQLHWFDKSSTDNLYKKYHWKLLERTNFGTGYIDLAKSE